MLDFSKCATPSGYALEWLSPPAIAAAADELAEVLRDCVEGGASVSFLAGLSREDAVAFWHGVAASSAMDERIVIVARRAGGAIAGTVQMIPTRIENQPHRAEVAKMLVHRGDRRQGLGAALMRAAEVAARAARRWLLVLDTASPEAARLYVAQGWRRLGEIPDYALLPDGRLCATTIFWKRLETANCEGAGGGCGLPLL